MHVPSEPLAVAILSPPTKDVQELARIVDALKTAKDNYWATEVEVQRSERGRMDRARQKAAMTKGSR